MYRALFSLAAILGGAVWIARFFLDGDLAEALSWLGLGLVLLGAMGVGLQLVSKSPMPLRVVVAVGITALVWSVYAVVRGDSDGRLLDLVLGVLVVLFALTQVGGRPRGGDADGAGVKPAKHPRGRHGGSHSA